MEIGIVGARQHRARTGGAIRGGGSRGDAEQLACSGHARRRRRVDSRPRARRDGDRRGALWRRRRDRDSASRVARPAAGAVRRKVIVDANDYYPDVDGPFPELDGSGISSSAALASLLPGAHVVKAFDTLYFKRLLDDNRPDLPAGERLAIPVAADFVDATRTIIDLIDEIGCTGVAAGSRRQQPGTTLYEAYRQARMTGATVNGSRLGELPAVGCCAGIQRWPWQTWRLSCSSWASSP